MFLHELAISDLTIKSRRISFFSMMILAMAVVCACAGIVGAKRQAVSSQNSQSEKSQPQAIVDRVPLTILHVSVYDKDGKLVDGLQHDAFDVFEDGVRQKIAVFSHEDEPARIGLLVDASGSVFQAITPAKEALKRFVQGSNPQDKFFGVTFHDSLHPMASLEELSNSLDARGSTKMLDALYFGLVELEDTHNSRKALLIISDGGDNHSKHTRDDLRRLVKEAGVPIYALAGTDSRVGREQVAAGAHFLDELCKMSGGRFVRVKELTEMPSLAAEIATELRQQYVVGYYPSTGMSGPVDAHWRKIEVKVQSKDVRGPLKVYAPEGYFRSANGNIL